MLKRFSFPKTKRLVKGRQFDAVLGRRLRASMGSLTLYMAQNECGYPRLGISVGKDCGGAVVRNRIKRLLREAFRQSQELIPRQFDYVLMVLPVRLKSSFSAPAANKEGLKQWKLEQVKKWFLALVNNIVGKIGC